METVERWQVEMIQIEVKRKTVDKTEDERRDIDLKSNVTRDDS